MKLIEAVKFAFTNKNTHFRAVAYFIGLFLLMGIPTALLSNPILPYVRMTPATALDYFFLTATSLLATVYVVLPANNSFAPDKCAIGGGFLGFIAFSCPICNKLLVLLLSFDFMYNFVNPLRPILGVFAIAILIHAIEKKWEL